MSKRDFKYEKGFLTFALGKTYIKLAYLQALSIKITQKNKNYAVIVDKQNETLANSYKDVFDEIIVIDHEPTDWDMTQHHTAFELTPFCETIMLDADMIMTESIDHWWPSLQLKDVCLTNEVHDFMEKKITSKKHRQLFEINHLPNVYAGMMYFRSSQFAAEFFMLLKHITDEWAWFANEHLIKNTDKRFRIDEAVSLAARIVGVHNVTLPAAIPTFVHAKSELLDLANLPWYEQLYAEYDERLIVGHYIQRLPFHYHYKEWINNDIIEKFERNYRKLLASS